VLLLPLVVVLAVVPAVLEGTGGGFGSSGPGGGALIITGGASLSCKLSSCTSLFTCVCMHACARGCSVCEACECDVSQLL
jgi:hypothetical protein